MKHEEIKEKLFAFYDGELPGAEQEEITVHLRSCLACRQSYEQWKQIAFAAQVQVDEERRKQRGKP